jgi:hypothetical protein
MTSDDETIFLRKPMTPMPKRKTVNLKHAVLQPHMELNDKKCLVLPSRLSAEEISEWLEICQTTKAKEMANSQLNLKPLTKMKAALPLIRKIMLRACPVLENLRNSYPQNALPPPWGFSPSSPSSALNLPDSRKRRRESDSDIDTDKKKRKKLTKNRQETKKGDREVAEKEIEKDKKQICFQSDPNLALRNYTCSNFGFLELRKDHNLKLGSPHRDGAFPWGFSLIAYFDDTFLPVVGLSEFQRFDEIEKFFALSKARVRCL